MKDRFLNSGRPLLVDALRRQPLVEFNADLAEALADAGQLTEFAAGDTLVTQGGHDSHVLFLLIGEVDVNVNGRLVATRVAGTTIGEMALVSPTARRSATVTARKPSLALMVEQPAFQNVASRHPQVWRPYTDKDTVTNLGQGFLSGNPKANHTETPVYNCVYFRADGGFQRLRQR